VKQFHMLSHQEANNLGTSFMDSVLAYATLGCKQKERYKDSTQPPVHDGSLRSDSLSKSSEDELVIIPSQDSQDLSSCLLPGSTNSPSVTSL
jgi:hypothetical protein